MNSPDTATEPATSHLIGVVTVTYNSADYLPSFFESCANQTHPFRLYAVDNASTDDCVRRLREEQRFDIRVIEAGANLGVAAGNNLGIRAALDDGCSHILLLNNDTVFPTGLFGSLLATSLAQPRTLVSPEIRYTAQPEVIWYTGADFTWKRGWASTTYHKDEHHTAAAGLSTTCTYAPTCCLLVPAEVFSTVGLMDEDYFVYSDDQDFAWRATHQGWIFYIDRSLTLCHTVGGSTGGLQSPFTAYQATMGRYLFIRKHRPLHERVAFGAGLLAWIAMRWARRVDTRSLAGRRLAGFSAAIRTSLTTPQRYQRRAAGEVVPS